MARRPKTVLTSFRPEFNIRGVMGNFMTAGVFNGMFAYVEVYNNATDGRWLYVCGLEVWLGVNCSFALENYAGSFGNVPADKPAMPIVGGAPLQPGILSGFGSTQCVGNHIGGGDAGNQLNWSWSHPWPVCVVPPGWSFAVMMGTQTSAMVVGAWWYSDSAP